MLIEQIGEMTQKSTAKQFKYWQIQEFRDLEQLLETIGEPIFMEALNAGLESIARKRAKANADPTLTDPQNINIRRMRDLVAMRVFTIAEALDILVNKNGIDLSLARKNLENAN